MIIFTAAPESMSADILVSLRLMHVWLHIATVAVHYKHIFLIAARRVVSTVLLSAGHIVHFASVLFTYLSLFVKMIHHTACFAVLAPCWAVSFMWILSSTVPALIVGLASPRVLAWPPILLDHIH